MPCSGLTLQTADGSHILARTLDFDQNPGAVLLVIPRKWPLFSTFAADKTLESKYAQIAMGITDPGKFLMTLDGVNEHGLCGAMFYYPNCAYYQGFSEGKTPLSPSLAIQYVLAKCQNLTEAERLFRDEVTLIDEITPALGKTPPLHYFFSDCSGDAMVVEPDADGLKIYRDTVGVMTNAPGYLWHETNLRNYLGVNREPQPPLEIKNRTLPPITPNAALWGLPGDYTSVSRFVRVAYLRQFIKQPANETEGVTAAFHVLSAVNVPQMRVGTDEAEAGYTMYTAAMSADSKTYYFHTYNDRRIQAVSLEKEDFNAKEIMAYQWSEGQDINWRN